MEGHILRNCPEKDKYTQRLNSLKRIGTASVMMIEAVDKDPSHDMDEIANYIADFEEVLQDSEESPEFDNWICELFDVLDSVPDNVPPAYHVDYKHDYYLSVSIPNVPWTFGEMMTNTAISVFFHLLLDTGAPKSICSLPRLSQAKWNPIRTFALSANIKTNPFRWYQSSCTTRRRTYCKDE